MRRAAIALRSLAARLGSAVGIEGAFLTAGTIALAVGSSYFSAAGPWIVAGAVCVLLGIALAVAPRSS